MGWIDGSDDGPCSTTRSAVLGFTRSRVDDRPSARACPIHAPNVGSDPVEAKRSLGTWDCRRA